MGATLSRARTLIEAIQKEVASPSSDPAKGLQQRILGDRRHTDDVCILTLAVIERPVQELNLTFTAIPIAAPLVRHAVRQMIKGLALDENQSFALQVAIGEAVNNAIEHAYGATTPGMVVVRPYERRPDPIESSQHQRQTHARTRRRGTHRYRRGRYKLMGAE